MSEIFFSLATVTAVALIASFASVKIRIPPVIGLIFIGMLFGPHGLGFVEDTEIVNIFAEMGSILLLFLIGTEFSLSKIKNLGLNAIIVAVIELGIVFMISYEVSQLIGFSPGVGIFIAITLSVTSTALTVKLLQEMGMGKRPEVPLLVGVSVIEDLFAIFALAFISSLAVGKSLSFIDMSFSMAKAFLIFTASFFILSKSLSFFFVRIKSLSKEMTVLLGFSLVMGMSFISIWMGFSPVIGAFIAGSIVASLPRGKEVEESAKHLGLLFISLFFLSIGMMGDPKAIFSNLNIIFIFVAVAMIGKFAGISLGTFFAGYSGRSCVFSGLAMLPIGEISLLIAKSGVDIGILEPGFLGIMSILVIITSLISYPGVLRHEMVYNILDRIIPIGIKRMGVNLARIFTLFRIQLSPGGRLFKVMINSFRRIFFYMMITSFFITLIILTRVYVINNLLFFTLAILAAIPFYFVLVNVERMVKSVPNIMLKFHYHVSERTEIKNEYIQALGLLIFAFFISPLIGAFTKIPYLSLLLSTASIILSIVILFNISKHFDVLKERMTKRKYQYKVKNKWRF